MAGLSRPKDGVASLAYARPSRLGWHCAFLIEMRGSSPRMTADSVVQTDCKSLYETLAGTACSADASGSGTAGRWIANSSFTAQ